MDLVLRECHEGGLHPGKDVLVVGHRRCRLALQLHIVPDAHPGTGGDGEGGRLIAGGGDLHGIGAGHDGAVIDTQRQV